MDIYKSEDLRYERKFVISELGVYEVEHLIKHHPAIFSEKFYERVVNNIYLDSYDYKNYSENIHGSAQRLKIRIRWYGKMFGLIKNPILELKIKNNELGTKKTFKLKSFILNKNFSGDYLHTIFLESSLPLWLIEELKLCHPTLLNSYKRRYFISADKKYRLTLDWNLVFFKIKRNNNFFIEKITNNETCVLELKYPLKDCMGESSISQYFPFRLVAHSKYINGVDLMNL